MPSPPSDALSVQNHSVTAVNSGGAGRGRVEISPKDARRMFSQLTSDSSAEREHASRIHRNNRPLRENARDEIDANFFLARSPVPTGK